ncbi:MAG: hypothetical protein DWQ01_06055 [Planctomycetota bacterium]|nr:MAG: hypothetical protein DWQ01_06055 [Planctomycetota bacterium]
MEPLRPELFRLAIGVASRGPFGPFVGRLSLLWGVFNVRLHALFGSSEGWLYEQSPGNPGASVCLSSLPAGSALAVL